MTTHTTLSSLLDRYTAWQVECARIQREEPHSSRAREGSDDEGLDLLHEFAAAVRAHEAHPCRDGPVCLHCGGPLTWFADNGAHKVGTSLGWTDQCPPSPDRYHHPNYGEAARSVRSQPDGPSASTPTHATPPMGSSHEQPARIVP